MKKIILLFSLNLCVIHLQALIPNEINKQKEIENEVNEYMTSLMEENEILKNNPAFIAKLESSCKSLFAKAQQAKQECKAKDQEDITLCSQYSIANKKYREYKELLLFLKYGIDIKAQNAGNVAALILMSTMQQMSEEIEGQVQQNAPSKKTSEFFETTQF